MKAGKLTVKPSQTLSFDGGLSAYFFFVHHRLRRRRPISLPTRSTSTWRSGWKGPLRQSLFPQEANIGRCLFFEIFPPLNSQRTNNRTTLVSFERIWPCKQTLKPFFFLSSKPLEDFREFQKYLNHFFKANLQSFRARGSNASTACEPLGEIGSSSSMRTPLCTRNPHPTQTLL